MCENMKTLKMLKKKKRYKDLPCSETPLLTSWCISLEFRFLCKCMYIVDKCDPVVHTVLKLAFLLRFISWAFPSHSKFFESIPLDACTFVALLCPNLFNLSQIIAPMSCVQFFTMQIMLQWASLNLCPCISENSHRKYSWK